MATLVLSALGASLGGAVGGTALGLSSAVIGRAVGATLGRAIDQRILGRGSDSVPVGRVERFHLSGASEGVPIAKVFGRVRIGGQVIWASRFREDVVTTGGSGKGNAGRSNATSTYRYSVSLALALGEGVVSRVGRIWADGAVVSREDFNLRFYPGDETQLPDAKIEAVEGAGKAPAFRGVAYVVFEDLDLSRFGNRVPQFSFEVFRKPKLAGGSATNVDNIKAVALIPGTGEYALATSPVHFDYGPGVSRSANVNSASDRTDFATSLDDLRGELGNCGSVSLVVSWFGDDLRANACRMVPRVEQTEFDGVGMPWVVSGVNRASAETVSRIDDRPVFGGTPADASVIEAIGAIRGGGQEVMFYPFVLMDIQAGNTLSDPWSDAASQPVMPWRGRLTLSEAPGRASSPDQTAAAEAEIAAFFGVADVADFAIAGGQVVYSGPAEWSYRRFILHYAHLCAAAGGVDAFCIGSELRSLTQIRGSGGNFPVVEAMRQLAADVRTVLGPEVKIGYAADWSEYFGYHPQDGSGDVLFHLDPLWADANIDFVGIDNYMPLSDWRDEQGHLDEAAGAIYDLDYLKGNVAGGEGYDWYYASPAARAHQIRSPISDGLHGEDWIYRYKDIRNWWSRPHHNRIAGVRQPVPTAWQPESKPILFTEYGCGAIDKATNQPNVFLDAKSSESQIPYFSSGQQDDLIQAQYLAAVRSYWGDEENNPVSAVYDGRMVDMDRAHVWAWDARPWPDFPNNTSLWSDGENHATGHWINGRTGAQALGDVVREICATSGVNGVDVSGLYGLVKGLVCADTQTARSALQPLMLAFGFDAIDEGGTIRFRRRSGAVQGEIEARDLVWEAGDVGSVSQTRAPEAETAGQVRLGYMRADGSYESGAVEAVMPDETALGVSRTDLPIVASASEAQVIVERWLAEARVAREAVAFALPPSRLDLGAGDVVRLPEPAGGGLARIDRIEDAGVRRIEAVRIEPSVYKPVIEPETDARTQPFVPALPVYPLFLDLPLLSGDEVPHAPRIAATATPWPGSVAVYSASEDAGYQLNRLLERPAAIGLTTTALFAAASGRWDRGPGVVVKMFGGAPASAAPEAVLNGANLAAIGSGLDDDWEVFQFTKAELVAPGTFALTGLLRGQAGSDPLVPEEWPIGSHVVLLNGAETQIELAPAARNLARHYRIGPARRGYEHGSYRHDIRAFAGIGLRPYAPCHLRRRVESNGDHGFGWIRRTRIDGDSWDLPEVPLGEASEAYLLHVVAGGVTVRNVQVSEPAWTYPAGMRAADGVTGAYALQVAQISERYGAGLYARIEINE
ncbi:MAG: glycoside hydrolase/phage tail family protein [Rhodobacteraceae bacterium]|nr:glycoside hydrolase/phage tail family protein [Paracoccaceae bacterium]